MNWGPSQDEGDQLKSINIVKRKGVPKSIKCFMIVGEKKYNKAVTECSQKWLPEHQY